MHIHIVKKKDGKIVINLKLDLQVLAPVLLLVKHVSKDKVDLLSLIDTAKKQTVTTKKTAPVVVAGSTGKGKRDGLFFYITK